MMHLKDASEVEIKFVFFLLNAKDNPHLFPQWDKQFWSIYNFLSIFDTLISTCWFETNSVLILPLILIITLFPN